MPSSSQRRGPTFVTPLTVQDYAANDGSSTTVSMARQRSSRQQQPTTSRTMQGTALSNSPIAKSSSARESATPPSSTVQQERQHTAAERRYRDGVQRSYLRLRQCLALHGLLAYEHFDSANDEGSNRVRKGEVLAAAVKAINELRRQEKDQDELIQRLEGHVRAAYLSLQDANPTAHPDRRDSRFDPLGPQRSNRGSCSSGSSSGHRNSTASGSRDADTDSEDEDDGGELMDTIMADWLPRR